MKTVGNGLCLGSLTDEWLNQTVRHPVFLSYGVLCPIRERLKVLGFVRVFFTQNDSDPKRNLLYLSRWARQNIERDDYMILLRNFPGTFSQEERRAYALFKRYEDSEAFLRWWDTQ